ncbi:MAG TPA: hypothetical protein VIW25_03455 [Nitrososphaeraceae archaeon]
MVRQRQTIGLVGMFFALTGGVLWFFQQTLFAVMLWGIAGIILLKLNKQKTRFRSKKQNKKERV